MPVHTCLNTTPIIELANIACDSFIGSEFPHITLLPSQSTLILYAWVFSGSYY